MSGERSEKEKFFETKAKFDRNFDQLIIELRERDDQSGCFAKATLTLETASQALRQQLREIWEDDEAEIKIGRSSKKTRVDEIQTDEKALSSIKFDQPSTESLGPISIPISPSERSSSSSTDLQVPDITASTAQTVAEEESAHTVSSKNPPFVSATNRNEPSAQTDVSSTLGATGTSQVNAASTIPLPNYLSSADQRSELPKASPGVRIPESTTKEHPELPKGWFDPANPAHQASLEMFKKKVAKLQRNFSIPRFEDPAGQPIYIDGQDYVDRLAEIYRNSRTLDEFATTLMLTLFDRAELDVCNCSTEFEKAHQKKDPLRRTKKFSGDWERFEGLDYKKSNHIHGVLNATRQSVSNVSWHLVVQSLRSTIARMALENKENPNWNKEYELIDASRDSRSQNLGYSLW